MFIADTMEEAKEKAGQHMVNYMKWVCHWRGLGNHMDPGEELPENFGEGSSLEALVDIIFSSRLEIKEGITKIARVLLKKHEKKSIADDPLQTIDESINETLSKSSKAV